MYVKYHTHLQPITVTLYRVITNQEKPIFSAISELINAIISGCLVESIKKIFVMTLSTLYQNTYPSTYSLLKKIKSGSRGTADRSVNLNNMVTE